ncbi:MAG: MBL fold metallo-hydrolase [bacterium]|nr:MBL fold metallo-hydrolase [bacterium]
MGVEVKKFEVGPLSTNCYILFDRLSREGIIIDPGLEDAKIDQFIKNEKINLLAIFLTHGHFDHIMGIGHYSNLFDIPVYIHKLDHPMLLDPVKNHSDFFGIPFVFEGKTILIEEEESIHIGPFSLQIIETPGHTRGSICILTCNFLFSGDTLFVDTVGRTDFPESAPEKLEKSLKKLSELDDGITVHPGHMASAKMSIIRTKNPFLKL